MRRARHINKTEKEFRAEKRRQYLAFRRAIRDSEIRLGSAYLPKEAFQKLVRGLALIEQSYEICKPWWKGY